MARRLSAWIVALTLVLTAWPSEVSAQPADLDARISAAFRSVYDLDQDAAMAAARSIVAAAPNESRAHRTLAAMLWIDVIFRRGAVTIDHYLGGVTKSEANTPKPPPALDAEFKQEIARAIELANARLSVNAKDLQARYDLGAAYGLQASYLAAVENRMTAALLSARRAYDAQEEVLEKDPKRLGAGVVVGTYRYMVAGMALPTRMFAYMMGFGGDKERGISLIQAATSDTNSHIEAKLALTIIFSREGRHADALRMISELAAEFPRNRIFVLEQGSAALRANKHSEAEAYLTKGLDMFTRDDRRKIPGERALWLYKRGVARMLLNRPTDSRTDLNAALMAEPENWVKGRIRLALGKVADITGQRASALTEYGLAQQIAKSASDPACQAEAERWLKRPFVLPPKS